MVADCSGFINFLDWECLFVNTFAGGWIAFGIIAVIGILMMAARFGMTNMVVGIMLLLFSALMREEMPWMFYIFAFIGLVLIGISIANIHKR